MGWTDTSTAITALRNVIFDGPQDKICSFKKVIGTVNGTNNIFKSFEYRRVTDLTTATFPLGAQFNGAPIPASGITSDDPVSGTFVVNGTYIPSSRDAITATYYYQWFTDSELDSFLQNSSTWLGLGTTYINIPDGLNASALDFSAREAYRMAAMKYSTRMSEVYKLEDAPDESIIKSVDMFKTMAQDFMSSATQLRDDYYTRQGQSLSPLFNLAVGSVQDPQPRR